MIAQGLEDDVTLLRGSDGTTGLVLDRRRGDRAVWRGKLARGWTLVSAVLMAGGLLIFHSAPNQDSGDSSRPISVVPGDTSAGPLAHVASWYGKWHDGRPTASGEPFDMTAFTAAHRSLPLGACVEVTNLGNGRRVVVRVNDRGPYVPGRAIDLSQRAAREIGMVDAGLALVRIRRTKVCDDPVPR